MCGVVQCFQRAEVSTTGAVQSCRHGDFCKVHPEQVQPSRMVVSTGMLGLGPWRMMVCRVCEQCKQKIPSCACTTLVLPVARVNIDLVVRLLSCVTLACSFLGAPAVFGSGDNPVAHTPPVIIRIMIRSSSPSPSSS